jgi:intron-binding protein aquarius
LFNLHKYFFYLGDLQPSRVRADVSVTLNLKKDVQEEWENLRKHDVCFLLTVQPILPIGKKCIDL